MASKVMNTASEIYMLSNSRHKSSNWVGMMDGRLGRAEIALYIMGNKTNYGL